MPITASDAQTIARDILAWRHSRTRRQPLTALARDDLDGAYAVQDALLPLLTADGGGEIVGYKIALTSAAMQRMVNVGHPLGGAVLAGVVHHSPAEVSLATFVNLGLECEVAVRLGVDLPADGAPYSRESVAARVDAVAPAYELVEDGGIDYDRIDAVTLIADNCWNGGVVLGEWVRGDADRWLDPAFAAAPTTLAMNGERVSEGKVGDAMGHPLEAVAWVANLLAGRGRTMRAGMLVMTGSSVRTAFPRAGDRARFDVAGLGGVDLSVVG